MFKTSFGKFIKKSEQDKAIDAGICLVQRKAKTQKVEVECLLLNVTRLTEQQIGYFSCSVLEQLETILSK